MEKQATRQHEMYLCVQECVTALSAQIPIDSYAVELLARLREKLAQLDAQAVAQSSSKRSVAESGMSKDDARRRLRAKVEAISRTARPLGKTLPGFAEKFRIPARLKDQDLLILARGFAEDAAPLKTEFVKRGLSVTFIEDLSAAASDFEQAVSRQIQSTESRVSSTATVKGHLRECLDIVREL